jgi:hypothetical protein
LRAVWLVSALRIEYAGDVVDDLLDHRGADIGFVKAGSGRVVGTSSPFLRRARKPLHRNTFCKQALLTPRWSRIDDVFSLSEVAGAEVQLDAAR